MKIIKLKIAQTGSEKLGIENIKLILGFVFSIVNKLLELLSSIGGTFNVFAALSIVQEIVTNLSILQQWRVALDEIKDLDEAETNELSLFFNMNFDIENDELEQRIEEGVAFIPRAYRTILDVISLGSDMVNWYNSFGENKVIEISANTDLPEKISLKAA